MRPLLAAFFALVLFSAFALAVSSDEARAKAADYIKEDSSEILQLSKPLQVGADSYWVFFRSILSTNKILVAVSDYSGEVVTDRARLSEIGLAVYQYSVVEEYLKKNNWSFDAFDAALYSSYNAVIDNSIKLSDLRVTTEATYNLSYVKVDSAMQMMEAKISEAQSFVSNGKALQENFELDYSAYSIAQLLDYYNQTYGKIFDVLAAHEAYSKSLSDMQSRVYKSSIPNPDNKNIYDSLEALRDVGLSQLYSLKANDPRVGLQRKNAAAQSWVNDSIASFFSRKARLEALSLYAEVKPNADGLLSYEENIKACGYTAEFNQFRNLWAEVEYLNSKGSESAYVQMVNKTARAQVLYNALLQKYQSCVNPLNPTTTPYQPPSQDNSWIWLVAGAAVAFFAYQAWQKRQQEETY